MDVKLIYEVGLKSTNGNIPFACFCTIEKAKEFKKNNTLLYKKDFYICEIKLN